MPSLLASGRHGKRGKKDPKDKGSLACCDTERTSIVLGIILNPGDIQ